MDMSEGGDEDLLNVSLLGMNKRETSTLSHFLTFRFVNVSQVDLPTSSAKQTTQLRRMFYPGSNLRLLRQSPQIVCRSFFL